MSQKETMKKKQFGFTHKSVSRNITLMQLNIETDSDKSLTVIGIDN